MKSLLFIFACLLNVLCYGQGVGAEDWVLDVDGKKRYCRFSFDARADVLILPDAAGEHREYTPEEVLAFSFQGTTYYSLPFNDSYSFFQVLHQGSSFAVLHKTASSKLLQYFITKSKGALQVCSDGETEEAYVLCEGATGPDFGLPAFGGASVSYQLQDATFIAVEGALHLLSCSYDTEGALFAATPSQHRKNKRLLRRLKEAMRSEQRVQALRQYVAAANPNLEDPQQLIEALKTVYP